MITGLQVAALAGALIALGCVALLWRFAPVEPDLVDAVKRLSADPSRSGAMEVPVDGRDPGSSSALNDRLGVWSMARLPAGVWSRTPEKDLALLEIPVHQFYGTKIAYGLVGLVLPPFLWAFFGLIGLPLPFTIPALASVAMAAFLFTLPNMQVREAADKARGDYRRALVAYFDLVALERVSGAGPRQAMEAAATVGDTRAFRRLEEELARSRWSGQTPWEAMAVLAEELDLPELLDLADIMRLSEHGAQVAASLRARVASMRDTALKNELARANAVSEKMSIPMSLLGVVFMAILVTPSLLRLFSS